MRAYCLTNLDELTRYADDWDRLAGGVPFRSWAWLSTWWRHYGSEHPGDGRHLYVPCVFDESERLVGVAPWYIDYSTAKGRVLRMLGSGEVCTDYLGLLALPGWEEQVARAVADMLSESERERAEPTRWDLLDLSGIDAEDVGTQRLAERLGERGHAVHRLPGPSCWRINLPQSWEEYLAMLAKRRRRQFMRLDETLIQSGRAQVHFVEQAADLPTAWEVLVELHQRRWRTLAEPGCFASERFRAFHQEVMPALLRAGQLQLAWLDIDGRPAAAHYEVTGSGIVYAYQSGVDPDRLDFEPGNLITMVLIRRSIEQGFMGYDFLRGDEPYKALFRAEPRPGLFLHIVPARIGARARHRIWQAGSDLKRWLKKEFAGE